MATTRISTDGDGNPIDGTDTSDPGFSPDGTRIIFRSDATNLVADDTNGSSDVFVKNLVTDEVTLVSTSAQGVQGDQGVGGSQAVFSPDGTKVLFYSDSTNLVPGDTNQFGDLFVKDLTTGAITRVSTSSNGTQGNGEAEDQISSFSPDGTSVTFGSIATNLVTGDNNFVEDGFIKNLTTGVTTRVTLSQNGTEGDSVSFPPAFSADGTKLVFSSNATNLVTGDTNGDYDIFLKDLTTDTITRISTKADGSEATGGNGSFNPTFSSDGTKVVFTSRSADLVPGGTDGVAGVFVKTLATGAITRVSAAIDGTGGDGDSFRPRFSPDGTKVVFDSSATNLVPGDTNTRRDIFVKDLTTGAVSRINVSNDGLQAIGGDSLAATFAPDGQTIAYSSSAINLDSDDDNGAPDIFVSSTIPVVCFAGGTLIGTARGAIAVEQLAIGDLVVAASGEVRPIRWLGHRAMDCRRHPRPHEVMPVRIEAHAFGEGRPARDLRVSPGHAICVDLLGEVLIPAAALVNGATIVQEEVDQVTYWHVELDAHDILLAEGLPCESYCEMGNRGFFAESGVVAIDASPDAPVPTHADFCRPFHADGALVDLVRARLVARAAEIGWRLEEEPLAGLHLLADGVRLEPQVRGPAACFLLPGGASEIWLVSGSGVPAQLGRGSDTRRLGLCVAAIVVDDGFGDPRRIEADDARLADGFHAAESGSHRWTDGRARLPAALWEGSTTAVFLRLDLAQPALPRWRQCIDEVTPAAVSTANGRRL